MQQNLNKKSLFPFFLWADKQLHHAEGGYYVLFIIFFIWSIVDFFFSQPKL